MADYIRRDLAIKAMRGNAEQRTIAGDGTHIGRLVPMKEAAKRIGRVHAADVAPIAHGRWIDVDIPAHGMPGAEPSCGYRCSICGREEDTREPYCHCGAKMDLKEGDPK